MKEPNKHPFKVEFTSPWKNHSYLPTQYDTDALVKLECVVDIDGVTVRVPSTLHLRECRDNSLMWLEEEVEDLLLLESSAEWVE